MGTNEGRRRVVVKGLSPEVEGGRYPVKRAVGEKVVVEANIFADGHDALFSALLYRGPGDSDWNSTPMTPLGNDRWRAEFSVDEIGVHAYTVRACVDHFGTWRHGLRKKVDGGQDVSVDLLAGAQLIEDTAARAKGRDRTLLRRAAASLRSDEDVASRVRIALHDRLTETAALYPDLEWATTYERPLRVVVDRPRARFGAWYEMFPRSCSARPGEHGTLADCAARLPYVASMGFDVVYLPPIHPIGHLNRKGRNNAPQASEGDLGSPWAIGSSEGGHKSVHPKLGTLDDLRGFLAKAEEHGIEVALDLAFQCAPDHPYVREHPEWFRRRPDGAVQYAENPPKKYEDIFPLNFETDRWRELWAELKSVVEFWIRQGVRIFRVDNPHTKPFAFWEWMIGEIRKDHPETIFLSEAFTRPQVMYHLAKIGFTQSYTYFAWRNTKFELTEYFTELCRCEVREFFRPSLWPNTPDILTEQLQTGGRAAFAARLALAATLGASYGIYGPAFELCESRPREMGSEEYLDSEKYEIRHWDIEREDSLGDYIARVNQIRRENPALQSDWSLQFHPVDNDQIICYSKHTDDFSNVVVVVVNLDPHHTHAGWVEFGLEESHEEGSGPFQVHDLLGDGRFLWQYGRNYVELAPSQSPAQIFRVRRRIRTERDFDYFL
jgi:starch synthase (maltosyl-transferring)